MREVIITESLRDFIKDMAREDFENGREPSEAADEIISILLAHGYSDDEARFLTKSIITDMLEEVKNDIEDGADKLKSLVVDKGFAEEVLNEALSISKAGGTGQDIFDKIVNMAEERGIRGKYSKAVASLMMKGLSESVKSVIGDEFDAGGEDD